MEAVSKTRKNLRGEYERRAVRGGIGAVKNGANGMMLLESAADITSKKNRFEFAKSSGLCVYPALKADWDLFGAVSFSYEILESIEKPEDRSMKDFAEDMELLRSAWREKLDKAVLY